uniref:Protein BatD n=1 Tax=candidate division WOR-3 bacterium TaxID=2052148 RepID=A0A7C4TCV8_UNCW3
MKINHKFQLAIWLLLAPFIIFSAELEFTASVDRTTVGLGETFTLNVSVSGENISGVPSPKLPDLPDFNILGRSSSQSTNISFINGRMSQKTTITFVYTLSPKKIGKFTIGSCKIDYQGKTYETQEIEIEVVKSATQKPSSPATPPPSGGSLEDGVMVIAVPSRREVYQGEQINVSFYLYTRYEIENVNLTKMPNFSGFWCETIYETNRLSYHRKVYEGKTYYVALIKTIALFPITSGTLVIDPMEITLTVIRPPRDFFDFFGTAQTLSIASKSISINVLPLPQENRPEDFCGGVGNFTISARLDRDTSLQGEPVNLIVKIGGRGNLRLIEKPKLPAIPNTRILEPEIKDNIQVSNDVIKGSREFRFPIIPQVDGEHIIPEIRVAYFNPKMKNYELIKTEKLHFVAAGTVRAPAVSETGGLKVLGTDICYIKPDSKNLSVEKMVPPRYLSLIYLVSFFIIGFSFFYQRHQKRLLLDRAYARKIRSGSVMRRNLKEVENYLKKNDAKNFYSALGRTIISYLGDRFNIDASALTREQLKEEISRANIPEETIRDLMDVLYNCEVIAYAPADTSGKNLLEFYKRARDLINRI